MNKWSFKGYISILALLTLSLNLIAQNTTYSGTVVDKSTGESLIGANIFSGQKATISDFNGNFSIELSDDVLFLSVSYVGYLEQDIELSELGPNKILIQMVESTNMLETATITSGKYEKALGEITVSLEILKPEIIENTNTSKFSDILEKIPGVTIIDGQANIRGGSGYSFGAGSRVLLLIDDIPALQADAGFPNWDDIPLELTNQIEVLKGASSALYGSAAMNGIINLRTDFAKAKPETKAAFGYTHYLDPKNKEAIWWNDTDTIPSSSFAYITHKQKFDKLDLVSSLFYKYENSFNRATYIKYLRGSIGLRYRLNDRLIIGMNANIKDGQNQDFFYWKNHTDLSFQGTESTFSESDNTRFFIDPYINYFDRSNNRHKFLGRVYRIENNVSNNRANKSSLYYGEYQFQRLYKSLDLTMTAGFNMSYNTSTAELYSNATITSNNSALYLQMDKKIGDRWNLSAGVRYERNQITAPDSIFVIDQLEEAGTDRESKPVFRFGANFKAAEYTFLRASFGQGYRFPTIAEKYLSTNVGFNITPNIDLFSETGWTQEIGVKQGFKLGEFKGLADLAFFRSQYNDMIEYTFDGRIAVGFQSLNIGNTDINGIDFNITGKGEIMTVPLNLIAGYTYIQPRFQEFGEEQMNSSSADSINILKYRFEHTAKFDLSTSYNKFNVGVAGYYYSHMKAIDAVFNFLLPGINDYRLENNKGFAIFDIRASYLFKEKLKFSLLAKNIFNKTYVLRPGLLEAPLNIGARFDYRF